METLTRNTDSLQEIPAPINKKELQCPLYLYSGNCHNKKNCLYKHTRKFFRSQLQVKPKSNGKKPIEFVPSADIENKQLTKSYIDLFNNERAEFLKEKKVEEENKINDEVTDNYNPFLFSKPRPQASKLKISNKEFTPGQSSTDTIQLLPSQQPIPANPYYDNQVFFDEYIDPAYLQDLGSQKQSNQGIMQVSNLPAQQGEIYYPGSASCDCCHGHVYSCSGAVCRNLGACHCYLTDFDNEQDNM